MTKNMNIFMTKWCQIKLLTHILTQKILKPNNKCYLFVKYSVGKIAKLKDKLKLNGYNILITIYINNNN